MDFTDLMFNAVYGGYPVLLLIVVLLVILLKQHRARIYTILATMNLLLACAGILKLGSFIGELFNEETLSYTLINRATGPYWLAFWLVLLLSIVLPQLFWLKKYRTNILLSLLAAASPLYERLIILFTSFHRDYLPSSWETRSGIVVSALMQNTLMLLVMVLLLKLLIYSVSRFELRV